MTTPPPPGQPIDPSSGHGPPPGGPAQPPGGYGAAPPPGPGAWGPPPVDGTSAWSYGWRVFTKNIGPFITISIASTLITLVLLIGGVMLDGGFDKALNPQPGELNFNVFQNLGTLIAALITMILSLGLLRMAFDVLDGRKAELGRMFQGYSVGTAIGTVFVTGILMLLALCACIFPIIFVGPLLMFALPAVVGGGAGIGDAITGSARLLLNNPGPVAIFVLVFIGLNILAACTCGLGNIILTPVSYIALACLYRQLTGGPVTEPS